MSQHRTFLLILILIPLSILGSGLAQDTNFKREIEARTEAFVQAMEQEDYARVMQLSLPPRIISTLSENAGVSEGALLLQVVVQMEEAMNAVEMIDFGFDTPNMTLEKANNQTPYAVIPTSTTMRISDGRVIEATSVTLALQDGEIYFIRVAEPQQLLLLTGSYPEFSGLTFPSQQIRILSEDDL